MRGEQAPMPPTRRTVLVADDDAEVRGTLAEYLRAQGFEVVEVGDGIEALGQVKRVRPASVVLDLLMPRLGGLEAIKGIRTFDPAITVVIVTGVEDAELQRRALSLGAAAVLTKPVALANLRTVLGRSEGHPGGSAETLKPPSVAQAASAGRILIVDDEPEIRAVLEGLLTQHGYQASSAADGAAAVRAVIDDAPDVVLLDIAMPRLGGIEALTALRAIAPEIKVVMVSGQADLQLAKRALAYGAFDYVAKPVDPAHLALVIAAALAWKGLQPG